MCKIVTLIDKTIWEINPPIVYNRVIIKEIKQSNCSKSLEFRVIDNQGIIFSQKISTPQKFEIIAF